jgi:hypothetical protein
MSKIIVLAASEECQDELRELGFKQETVWMRDAPGTTTDDQKQKGESLVFGMKRKPFMFLVSSWWGMGPD